MSTNASSTAPVVVATLMAQLCAEQSLSEVQILYGDSGKAERENIVISGDIHWDDEEFVDLGARSRQEVYDIDGFCQVNRPGDSQQEALERAFAIVAVIEALLRNLVVPSNGLQAALDAAFGTANAQVVNLGFRPSRAIGFPGTGTEGRSYQIDFAARVTARI